MTADGRVITDLRRDEVQVLDNGVPQPLVAFEYVDLTTVTGPPQRRDFVLVLDDLQIDPRTTKPAQDVSLALIDLLGANDRLAIVNTSPHELRQQFSTDRVQARALVRRLRGQQGAPIPQVWEYNTRRLLDVLDSVASALKGDVSERRTVVVVSEGRLALDPDRDMLQDYRDVVRAAALSNIVVHGIDPRGLLAPQPAPATQGTSVDVVRGSAENRAASNAARRFGALGRRRPGAGHSRQPPVLPPRVRPARHSRSRAPTPAHDHRPRVARRRPGARPLGLRAPLKCCDAGNALRLRSGQARNGWK